jgi:2-polyprenyl-3-methyl-5-hydroxy-6-metoxy-1,4-benzoquinol methylase
MNGIICPDCGNTNLHLIGVLPDVAVFAGKSLDRPLVGGALYKCAICSLAFRAPRFEANIYNDLYDNSVVEAWTFDESRQDQKLVSTYIHRHLPSGARILDVGCYAGALLGSMDDQFEKFGVEINSTAAGIARSRFNITTWRSLSEIPTNVRFNAILATDVIEHLTSPRQFIESLLSRLEEGGFIVITSGDADNFWWRMAGARWWYCSFAEHISFISKSWLHYYSRILDFRVIKARRFRYKKLRFRSLRYPFLIVYTLYPALHKKLLRLLSRVFVQSAAIEVPGFGVSADHLFVVLSKSPGAVDHVYPSAARVAGKLK